MKDNQNTYPSSTPEQECDKHLEPIKPPKEQCSGGLFNLEGPKSYPLFGDINGLTYDYWG